MEFKAIIKYMVSDTHPDIQDMPEKYWKEKVFSYKDTYTFSRDWSREEAINYIKRDMQIVAGGGYSIRHIYNVSFDIKEV